MGKQHSLHVISAMVYCLQIQFIEMFDNLLSYSFSYTTGFTSLVDETTAEMTLTNDWERFCLQAIQNLANPCYGLLNQILIWSPQNRGCNVCERFAAQYRVLKSVLKKSFCVYQPWKQEILKVFFVLKTFMFLEEKYHNFWDALYQAAHNIIHGSLMNWKPHLRGQPQIAK